jgi:heat shock protein HslJ
MKLSHEMRPPAWAAPLALVAVLAGCAPPAAAPPAAGPAPSAADTHVYRCEGDYRFSVRVRPDSALVRLGTGEVALPHVASASGARYAAGGVTYWSRGREATLETPSASYRSCVGQPVKTADDEARLLAGEGPAGIPLEGADWKLISAGGVPALPSPGGALPYLRFTAEEGRVAGSTGCNRLAGSYTVEGDRLRLTRPLVTTRMACVDAALAEQERRLLDALQRADDSLVWGDVLTLFDGEEVVARFTTGG